MSDHLQNLGADFADRFRAGDESAFDELFRRYHGSLTHFAFSVLHDENEAEDVVQDCFVRFWERRFELQHVKEVNAYLYQAVRFAAYNKLRNKKLHVVRDEPTEKMDEALQQAMIQGEVMAHIAHLLNHLPERMKQVLTMHYLEDKTLEEISAITGIHPETVRSHRYRGLRMIRNFINAAKAFFI